MRARRLSLTLLGLAVVTSACSGGSSAAPATSTVTATVTATSSTATASPPHIVVTPSQSSLTTSSSGSTLARCDGPQLAVTVGESEGAAGTIFYPIRFTNRGSTSCFLQGFPGVAAADAGGAAQVDATRNTSTAATRVVLAPGRTAHANLGARNVPPSSAPCPTYPLLLVTPPDSRRTSTIAQTVRPCANQMSVTVVQAGAS